MLGALGVNGNGVTSGGPLTGDTVLNDGTLVVTGDSAPAFTAVNVINDGVFDVASPYVQAAEGAFTNAGTLDVSSNGGSLEIEGGVDNDTGMFNSGLITVSAGATLQYGYPGYAGPPGGTFNNTGLIDVSGGTFVLDAATTISTLGSIKISGGGLLSLGGNIVNTGNLLDVGAGTEFSNVDMTGVITGGTITASSTGALFGAIGSNLTPVSPAYLIGVVFEGPLLLGKAGESLTFENGVTLKGTNGSAADRVSVTGSGAELNFDTESLANLSITLGSSGQAAEFGAEYISTLTLASSVSINVAGAQAALDELDQGNLINNGTITDAVAGNTLTISGLLSNSGSMELASGATLLLNYDYAELDNEAGGVITLSSASLADTFGPDVTAESGVSNAGLMSGKGTLATPVSNTGTIVANGGTLTLTGPVDGTGELDAKVNSTLLLEGSVSAGSIVRFDGTNSVLGLSPPQFLGEIAGFAPGGTIDLLNEAASAAKFSGDSIVITLTASGTISLSTTSALSGTLSVKSDGHGGSLITFAQTTAAYPEAQVLPSPHA